MLNILLDSLITALEITLLVILLMSLVEILNIGTNGKLIRFIKNSKLKQTIISSFLAILPGCGGGFAVVSLYTHSVVTFGALCSAMICSMGDEAFYLIATSPRHYFLLVAILLPLGIICGLIIGLFSSKTESCKEGLAIHQEDSEEKKNTNRLTKFKHFIKEHLWNHILRHHFLSIFLWTFGTLLICNILIKYCDIQQFINDNTQYKIVIVAIAILVGLIPQSGPHMVFILLASQGVIPFYVVVVNLITAQGHVSLPLLSENRKSWVESKLVCATVALTVGILSLAIF